MPEDFPKDIPINQPDMPTGNEAESEKPKCVFLSATSTLYPDNSEEMQDLNMYLQLVNATQVWAEKGLSGSLDGAIQDYDKIYTLYENEKALRNLTIFPALHSNVLPSRLYRGTPNELREDIQKSSHELIGNPADLKFKTEPFTFNISSPDDLDSLSSNISRFAHDVGTDILAANLIIYRLKNPGKTAQSEHMRQDLYSTLQQVSLLLNDVKSDFIDEYPEGKLDIRKDLVEYLQLQQARFKVQGMDLHIDFPSELTAGDHWHISKLNIPIHHKWFYRTVVNVLQDTVDAYKRRDLWFPDKSGEDRSVSVKLELHPDEKNAILSFSDQATGFVVQPRESDPEKISKIQQIIETGTFPPDFSYRGINPDEPGTGRGLNGCQEAIERHYKGKVIPSNITDQAGNATGAMISLILPVENA